MTVDSPGLRQIGSEGDAVRLAEYLLDGGRRTPCVVVSVAAGQADPYLDVCEISRQIEGLAEVYVLPTGAASWAFSGNMPGGTQVYGGAARVYPVDPGWQTEPRRSPLRFAYGRHEGPRATEAIVSDALGMALAAGLMDASARPQMRPESGTVMGSVGGRAFVRTDSGATLTIWPELIVPGVSADRLLRKGMRVEGLLDDADRRLDVREMRVPVLEAVATYTPSSVVLGRVAAVDKQSCHLELVPDLTVVLHRAAVVVDDAEDLRTLMTVGETVLARVSAVGSADGAGWQLAMLDVGPDDMPTVAPGILRGGPPWLQPEDLLVDDSSLDEEEPDLFAVDATVDELPVHAPAAMGEGGSHGLGTVASGPAQRSHETEFTGSALDVMRAERDAMAQQLTHQQSQLDRAAQRAEQLKTKLRGATESRDRAQRELQLAKEQVRESAFDGELFVDRQEQLEFEIRLMWARRISPDEKARLPLRRYRLGEHFFSSWDQVQRLDRSKVVEVMVEVLTGRVHAIGGRETHQLRSGQGANDPFVSRSDGATCWRVALQRRTPQARRLHYWTLRDGTTEFSSIRLHDDFRP